MRNALTLAAIIVALAFVPKVAHAQYWDDYYGYHDDDDVDVHINVDVDFDFWDWWDSDRCYYCYQPAPWWTYPHRRWHPYWRNMVVLYYSPCGWYRYEYFSTPCYDCDYVPVHGRWVYRRAIRLERHYDYDDMGRDFVRRRGIDGYYRARETGAVSSAREYRNRGLDNAYDGRYRYASEQRSKSVSREELSRTLAQTDEKLTLRSKTTSIQPEARSQSVEKLSKGISNDTRTKTETAPTIEKNTETTEKITTSQKLEKISSDKKYKKPANDDDEEEEYQSPKSSKTVREKSSSSQSNKSTNPSRSGSSKNSSRSRSK